MPFINKKIWATVLALFMLLSLSAGLAACQELVPKEEKASPSETTSAAETEAEASSEEASEEASQEVKAPESHKLKIAALTGPTALGLLELMDDERYEIEIFGAPDAMIPAVVKGDFDIACLPANLAAILNKKTEGKIEVIGLNTLNVLYLVANIEDEVKLGDLKGQKIYMSGKSGVPEYMLRLALESNGFTPEEIQLQFAAEHSETLKQLISGEAQYALLPQPFLTIVQSKLPNLKVVANLEDEISAPIVMGVYVAHAKALQENEEAVSTFLDDAAKSVEAVLADPAAAGEIAEKHEILKPAALVAKAIPHCGLVAIRDYDEIMIRLFGFYEALASFDPASVGGEMPNRSLVHQFQD